MAHETRWYKDAVVYQAHVKAFYDSSGDGCGDLRGLAQKLDYLKQLGVTALWILPFYPSPLRDDGYDIADYGGVNPRYGSLADVKLLLREAHDRGLRVITELVLNHTSDQHAWFQRARRAKPGSRSRDFYVWSDTPDRYKEARIIFQDFEASNWTWDAVAGAYYWHRFYHHQPDLNFDNPEVCKAMLKVLEYWLDMGIDGLRLDAVPYLFEREDTNCENLPETHAFLKSLRKTIDERYADRMLLAEANQWPEDAVAYFGQGDECHAAFHFPVMPRMFMAVQMEDRFPMIDILENTPAIPESCQWFLFLRNHDELTLEMVTDEERDYMYRVYARDRQARINLGIRRRLAPLLGNDRRKIELLNGLLMALPGTPIIYYGDEIGMGDNIYLGDRDGVRTPMQWSADRNAGFSTANPQQLYLPAIIDQEYHYQAVNVETQSNNPHSLLWWMRRLVARRQELGVFGRGDLKFLYPDNSKVLAFTRSDGQRTVLVVANLSRYAQYCELDLSGHRGHAPWEIFGNTQFPRIGELPYLLTLGPYAFYWFTLQTPEATALGPVRLEGAGTGAKPQLEVPGDWLNAFAGRQKDRLEELLPAYLQNRRWFRGNARTIQAAAILEVIPLREIAVDLQAALVVVQVAFAEGEPVTYLLILGYTADVHEGNGSDSAALCYLRIARPQGEEQGLLGDFSGDQRVGRALLEVATGRRRLAGRQGRLVGTMAGAFRRIGAPAPDSLTVAALGIEESTSSFTFGDQYVVKIFRRLVEGMNPDLEISEFLTTGARFPHTPPALGAIEYRRNAEAPWTLAVVQGYVRNEGDAWSYTLEVVSRYFERVLAEFLQSEPPAQDLIQHSFVALAAQEPPALAEELCGPYLAAAELLGRRTAEMHLALAASERPEFAPEPISQLYQRSLYQAMRTLTVRTFRTLRERQSMVPAEAAREVLAREDEVIQRFGGLLGAKIRATRIRCHGDYHLGQVLYTGKDFVITDFEGEPDRPVGERRIKRSPLRDVAGMLRSLHYVAYYGAAHHVPGTLLPGIDAPQLKSWATFWHTWTGAAFLESYLATAAGASFVPHRREDLELLLDVLLLERAVHELGHELKHRPEWAHVPLEGILQLLRTSPSPVNA